MMTRKDFEAIAHILDANVADIGIVLDFTDLLEETNPPCAFHRRQHHQTAGLVVTRSPHDGERQEAPAMRIHLPSILLWVKVMRREFSREWGVHY
jgi:hypothetical protein